MTDLIEKAGDIIEAVDDPDAAAKIVIELVLREMVEPTDEMLTAGCNTLGHTGVPLTPPQVQHCVDVVIRTFAQSHHIQLGGEE